MSSFRRNTLARLALAVFHMDAPRVHVSAEPMFSLHMDNVALPVDLWAFLQIKTGKSDHGLIKTQQRRKSLVANYAQRNAKRAAKAARFASGVSTRSNRR